MNKVIKTLTKLNKLSLPVTILIASLVIGGFYYASEVNKQRSIERQQEIKLQEGIKKQSQLKNCLIKASLATDDYWNKLCKSYGVNDDGNPNLKDDCSLAKFHMDMVNAFEKNEQDQCYQLYK